MYTLHVGCHPEGISVIQDPDLILEKDLIIRDSKLDVYTFLNPTVNLGYCQVALNLITDIMINGVSNNFALKSAKSCGTTNPCQTIDISKNDDADILKFKMSTTITGGFNFKSDEITLNLKCGAVSALLIPSPLKSLMKFAQHTDSSIDFLPFNCMPSACCGIIDYSISTT